MNELEINIIQCLMFFGPCTLGTIQQKLDQRGIIKSQNDIDSACERLLERKQIREATGFHDKAYKI